LQQKPSTQLPDRHWLPAVHEAPFAWSALQCESLGSHQALAMHPLSLEQVVAHEGELPLHTYGMQLGAPGEPGGATPQSPF
jgi:hypothetical protein